MAKIYIICSVRKANKEEEGRALSYVEGLEKKGHEVRYPPRDTNQIDRIGLRIVEEHENDIIWADEIHIIWNPASIGSVWDVGQARMAKRFMPEKKIILVNVSETEITEDKSHTNVVLATHFGLHASSTLTDLEKYKKDK